MKNTKVQTFGAGQTLVYTKHLMESEDIRHYQSLRHPFNFLLFYERARDLSNRAGESRGKYTPEL